MIKLKNVKNGIHLKGHEPDILKNEIHLKGHWFRNIRLLALWSSVVSTHFQWFCEFWLFKPFVTWGVCLFLCDKHSHFVFGVSETLETKVEKDLSVEQSLFCSVIKTNVPRFFYFWWVSESGATNLTSLRTLEIWFLWSTTLVAVC